MKIQKHFPFSMESLQSMEKSSSLTCGMFVKATTENIAYNLLGHFWISNRTQRADIQLVEPAIDWWYVKKYMKVCTTGVCVVHTRLLYCCSEYQDMISILGSSTVCNQQFWIGDMHNQHLCKGSLKWRKGWSHLQLVMPVLRLYMDTGMYYHYQQAIFSLLCWYSFGRLWIYRQARLINRVPGLHDSWVLGVFASSPMFHFQYKLAWPGPKYRGCERPCKNILQARLFKKDQNPTLVASLPAHNFKHFEARWLEWPGPWLNTIDHFDWLKIAVLRLCCSHKVMDLMGQIRGLLEAFHTHLELQQAPCKNPA